MGTILKDSRICWLGLLKNAMVVKCLHVDIVETIVPLKDLNAFKQKCFLIFYFSRDNLFDIHLYLYRVISNICLKVSILSPFQ